MYAILHSNNRGALCVYNLSKDKTLYCVTYRTNAFSASNLKAHPDEYSYILANSFVVIYKIEETGIYIYLIDLVSGKVDELSYTLYDYLKSLSNVVNNEIDKQLINDMLSSPDFKLQIDNYYFSLLWDVEHVECIIDNHEKTVPFVKFLKLYFRINNIGAIYKRVDNALSVSFTLENNELFVQFGTGTGGAIEKTLGSTFKVTIPSNIVLSSKRYNLNSSYDISKSYPYYIYKVTQNYIFTRRYVFEQSPRKSHEYILNPELSDLYKGHNLYTIDSINLLKKKNNTIAQLNNNYSRQKLGVYIIGVDNNINPKLVNFVDLHKASPFLQKETYVDISNYTFDLNVFDKIMSSMSIEKEEIKSIESRIFYHFLLDTTLGLLYILIKLLPRDDDDSGDEYWLCKCNIRNPELPCEVVARIQFYKSKSIKNFINIAKNSVHLLEIMNKNIYDSKSSYSIHDRAYIYNDGLIVINNVLSVKIKDIRQNRTNVLQYIKNFLVLNQFAGSIMFIKTTF